MNTKYNILGRVFLYVALALFVFWIVFPFLWVVISSFMNIDELGAVPPHWIPQRPTLNNYKSVLLGVYGGESTHGTYGAGQKAETIVGALINSLVISLAVSLINIIIGGLAAYSISRFKTRINKSVFYSIIASRILPPIGMVIPFFIIFRVMKMINTPGALILSYNLFILPLTIWLLKSYFDNVPPDLEEMALVEGLGRFKALLLIVIPVAIPGFIAVFIMSMMECWSEFFFALVLTDQMTLPPVLIGFEKMEQIQWNVMAAATVVCVVPPVVVALIMQRYIVTGLTAGAVKG
jgi:ABC-type glycerol-3-phosphate transport system permease component